MARRKDSSQKAAIGQIMFCHEKYCRFHSTVDMITNFNVDAYDFRGCICSVNITLRQSRLSGVVRATFPDKQSHLVINYCIMF